MLDNAPPDQTISPAKDFRTSRWALPLCALSLLFKFFYLLDYQTLPFLRAPLHDSVIYLEQSAHIRAGRFGDPTLLAFSPLYGYLLCALDAIHHLIYPVLLQFGLGTLNLWLVFRLCQPRFGTPAAILSQGLYLGYGLLVFYESKLLSETLALTLCLLTLQLYLSDGFERGRPGRAVLCGGILGLSVLARASLLFAALLFPLAALLPWRPAPGPDGRARLLRGLGLGAGLLAVLGANGLWTLRHAGVFVPVILVSRTVSVATAPGFTGDFRQFSRRADGTVNAHDVVEQAAEYLQQRRAAAASGTAAPGPIGTAPGQTVARGAARWAIPWGIYLVGYLRGAPAKLRRTLSNEEITYEYGYFGERSEVFALRLLPVSFGALLLLGVVGAAALGRDSRGRGLLPYLPLFLGTLLTTTLFYPTSRYRVALVLPLLLLGGHGVVRLFRLPRRLWPLSAGIWLVCVLLSVQTITYRLRLPAQWELRVAQGAAVAGDLPELQRRAARARAAAPGDAFTEAQLQRYFAIAAAAAAPLSPAAPAPSPAPPGRSADAPGAYTR